MIFLNIFLIIINIIIFIYGSKNLLLANQIKNTKEKDLKDTENKIQENQNILNNLNNEQIKILKSIEKEKEKLDDYYEKEKNKISEQIKIYKDNVSNASQEYLKTLENAYEKAEKTYHKKVKLLNEEKKACEADLKKIQSALAAATEARLREQEIEQQLEFYKLSLSSVELEDVQKLNSIKPSLHQPVILSKLIWSTYFLKQTTELCNRILGKDKICGIYKITNLKTKQCYIGQSVSIADRWKEHIKCGLGIEASATNKLYKAMQNDGVWNFTFELIESCPREQLNEKEKFFIQMYQSDKLGYNSTKGGS